MNKFLETAKKLLTDAIHSVKDRVYLVMKWTDTIGSGKNTKVFLASVSLLISVVLWLFVTWDGDTEGARTLQVPLQYVNLSRGYTHFDGIDTVEVRLLGRMNALSRLQPSDFKAEVDLQALQTGTHKLPIRVEGPPVARIRNWTPTTADVEIYRQIERTLPISWTVDGKAPQGKIVSSVDLSPAEVTITGPEADVLAVQTVQVVIPAKRLETDLSLKLPVAVADAAAASERMQLSPTAVNVNITLDDEIVGEQIPVQISVIGSPADGLVVDKITVLPDKVTIRGGAEAVRNMTSLVLSPIDITGLDQNLQLMLPLQPEEMKDVEILGPERARVDIALRKKMVTRTFTSVPVIVHGAGDGKEWKVSPVSVTLTANGSQMAMDNLRQDQTPCELYVDVTNIVTNQLVLPVLVQHLKNDFQVIQVDPPQVTVTLVD